MRQKISNNSGRNDSGRVPSNTVNSSFNPSIKSHNLVIIFIRMFYEYLSKKKKTNQLYFNYTMEKILFYYVIK